MVLSEKLSVLRKERGLTQEALAEELGISRQSVSRWETGASVPSAEKLIRLSKLYEVPLDNLVGDGPPSGLEQANTEQHIAEDPPPRTIRAWVPWALLAAAALVLVIGIFIGLRLNQQEQAEEIETIPIEELERGRLDPDLMEGFSLIEGFD